MHRHIERAHSGNAEPMSYVQFLADLSAGKRAVASKMVHPGVLRSKWERIAAMLDRHETLKKSLATYLEKTGLLTIDLPNLIMVNNKYHVPKVGPDSYQEKGLPFQAWGTIQMRHGTPQIGGVSLMHMLTRIQKYCNIGSQLLLNYDNYYVQLKMKEEQNAEAKKKLSSQ